MKYIYTLVIILFVYTLNAQSALIQDYKDLQSITYSDELKTPSHLILEEHSPLRNLESKNLVSRLFDIPADQLILKNETELDAQIVIIRYIRYVDNIRVPHGSYTVLKKNNAIVSVHGEHYNSEDINRSQTLTEEEALSQVLPHLGSELFSWESTLNLMKRFDKNSNEYSRLEKALNQDYPKGELVFVKDYYNEYKGLELAYLFTIESVIPEFRDRIYVSANDGRILLKDPQLKHGSGDTRYSGTRSFPSTEINGPPGAIYELKGTEPLSGIFCETRSLEGLGGLPASSPAIVALSDSIADGDAPDPCLTDMSETIAEFGDDVWNSNEHKKSRLDGTAQSCCPTYIAYSCDEINNDDIALDAHWGAAMVARYWKDIHNRFGYDNEGADIKSYVHHGTAYENASWNGMIMKYGDGGYQNGTNPSGMFGPLVALDVCAHEIGHAICTSTSDLVYVGESGALNEGFSDIWGAALERYVLDSIDGSLDYLLWGIAEQADERDGGLYNEAGARALRWMDHPPAENNPDTYGAGTWWQDPDCVSPSLANDFCGVHFNSGVLNKWFYLLSEGSGLALSPGLNKPAFDDEINDKGNAYSVTGIGVHKSEKIVYGAELLLLPNSRFADMRAASIDIARSLFGPCSNEVEQTIRAWYAVGVGPNFGTCLPTIEYNQFNVREVLETSSASGCGASKEINLSIFSYMVNATINFTTAGNAIEGNDYALCFNSLSFNGDEEKQLKILIYDDKIDEGNDTIVINFSGGGYMDSDTVIIINDDGIPAIGSLDTLLFENFDQNNGDWNQELVNPNSLLNEWFIDAFNSNQAHISYPPSTNVPSYTQIVESHIRLKSPQIDALGRQNVHVSFVYQVGGERDLVDPSALFDFGTFEISYDGFDWEKIDDFVGIPEAGGIVPDSGLYAISLPQLDNSTFYLGYTWYNDALNGSAYSFKIDSILVTGEGLEIESDIGAIMETTIPKNESVAFISTSDNEVIAILEDANADLGCTSISIIDNHPTVDTTASVCKLRSSKAFKIITENSADSILIKLFFKESEVNDWSDFLLLNILAVENVDIENETSGYSIIDNSKIVVDDQTSGGTGYVTYSFWISSDTKSLALTDRPSIPDNLLVTNITDSDINSFRYVVGLACPEDTIRFDMALDGSTILLTSGQVDFDKNLHIIGNGTSNTMLYSNSGSIISVLPFIDLSLMNISVQSIPPFEPILNNGQIKIKDNVLIGH